MLTQNQALYAVRNLASMGTRVCTMKKRINYLTPAEQEVLQELSKGKSDKEIAKARNTSYRTVENQLQSIYSKFGVSSRTKAVIHAIRSELVDSD